MFENIMKFFKKFVKEKDADSKDTAKERLHLVLMQDRANVSADFLELMKQEIIDVIKKYIDVDENSIDVKLTNKTNGDGTTGAPILYANIPIVSIKDENKNKVVNENKQKNNDNNKTVEENTSKEEKEDITVELKEEIEENKDEKEQPVKEDADNKKEQKDTKKLEEGKEDTKEVEKENEGTIKEA